MPAASTDKFIKGARRWAGQIGASGVTDASVTTIPLVSSTGLPTDTAVELTIDRVDANGTATPGKEEIVRGTVSGTNIINAVRGVEGTAQGHLAGAVVEVRLTASMWSRMIDALLVSINQAGKLIQSAVDGIRYAADAGGDDTYAVTLDPVPAAYYAGMEVNFKPTTANTGACTLDVNGLGAKTIKKNASSDLATGDILANQIVKVIYDGTNFQMMSPIPAAAFSAPQGFLTNGKIVPSVASNNLTLAIKTLAGTDPSATDPVYVRIGDTIRTIITALSVTKNAATNWMNAGSAELATKEIDYFVYLGYNATDGVVIGFSRFPGANSYDDFSATTTNEKYCAISTITTAAATDYYEVIGRFAATLSAGAGYTWSVPTYTAKNLIQRPIYETRWLDYVPQLSVSGGTAPTYTASFSNKYRISNKTLSLQQAWDNAAGGTAGNGTNPIIITMPFANAQYIANRSMLGSGFINESAGTTNMFVMLQASGSASNYVLYLATATSMVGNDQSSTSRFKCAQGFYEI